MIQELSIDGFRGFDNLQLGNLGHFNLVVGPVNSGKTCLLEAVFLFCSTGNPALLTTTLGLRGVPQKQGREDAISLMNWFFSATPGRQECTISGLWNKTSREVNIRRIDQDKSLPLSKQSDANSTQEKRVIPEPSTRFRLSTRTKDGTFEADLEFGQDEAKTGSSGQPNLPGRFLTTREMGEKLAAIWTKVQEGENEKAVIDLLQEIDPNINSVRIAVDELNQAALRIKHDTLGSIPMHLLGSGFGKAVAIASNLIAAQQGILIVDEFDSSLDVNAQARLIGFILNAARKSGVQLFVSTHSLEAVDTFIREVQSRPELWSSPDDFHILQLTPGPTGSRVRNLDCEEAVRLRDELGFDVRRTV